MVQKRSLLRHVCGLVVILMGFGAACAPRQRGPLVVETDVQYPPWVLGGTGVHAAGGQRVLVGVGQVDGMRNVALARATADNRARAELARVLEIYFGTLLADVEAGDHRGQPHAALPEVAATDRLPPPAQPNPGDARMGVARAPVLERDGTLVKALLAASLPSVQVVDHWFHPDRGAVFSEARLDVEEVRDGVARLRDVPEAMVSLLLARLEPVHEGMLAAREPPSLPAPAAPSATPSPAAPPPVAAPLSPDPNSQRK